MNLNTAQPTTSGIEPQPGEILRGVVAVLVTFNRLPLLQESIASLRQQDGGQPTILVVDNGCTDDTADWLAAQSDLWVITQGNEGSSGGQATGIKAAYSVGAEWIWCMDDDTIPSSSALTAMLNSDSAKKTDTGALCSVVYWSDGTPHRMNIPRLKKGVASYEAWLSSAETGTLSIEGCSFVSVLVHRRAVRAVGLPLREIFIWYDDVEYTTRISAHFGLYQVLASRVSHQTPLNHSASLKDMGSQSLWKLRYGLRNRIFIRRKESRTKKHKLRFIKEFLKLSGRVALKAPWNRKIPLLMSLTAGLRFSPEIEFVSKDS